jgi:GNAT superfamily N-acetyltransferase
MEDQRMSESSIECRFDEQLPGDHVLALHRVCDWSAADKPDELLMALAGSDSVVSAWQGEQLLGLGNAISDGAMVVYYPHLLVNPKYHRAGIGRQIMERLGDRYRRFHQQVLLAVDDAYGFYQRVGFQDTRGVRPMWIYQGFDL